MAKSKSKRGSEEQSQQSSDKPFIKVDKAAFDPALASLFASSVSFLLLFVIAFPLTHSSPALLRHHQNPATKSAYRESPKTHNKTRTMTQN